MTYSTLSPQEQFSQIGNAYMNDSIRLVGVTHSGNQFEGEIHLVTRGRVILSNEEGTAGEIPLSEIARMGSNFVRPREFVCE